MNKMILALVLMGFFKAGLAQVSTIDPEANKIIGTSRPDGRYLSTNGFVHQQIRELKPMLQFDPGLSRDEFILWQAKVRNKIRDLMQFPIVTPQPSPKLISKVKRRGYTVEKWEIFPQDGSVVPILMLIPDGVSASNPAPAVLCYPGSASSKEKLAGEPELELRYKQPRLYEKNHMAKFYAEKGLIAIAID
ncbi:MAG TPA: alpha/beta hydrolase family protein, partial [Flavitalea sp.]|nr:alpha/beta hydrolase family protein [Flavitalea sp.]